MKFTFRFSLQTFKIFTFLSCQWILEATYNNRPNVWPYNVDKIKLPAGYQSPININMRFVRSLDMPPLQTDSFEELSKSDKVTCMNTGQTVECSLRNTSTPPYIHGGPLQSRYLFSSIHWHWGKSIHRGSEHYINGNSYASELHIVHFKEEYRSVEEAMKHQDGLSVLAFFADVSSRLVDYTISPRAGPPKVYRRNWKLGLFSKIHKKDNPIIETFFDDVNDISVINSTTEHSWPETYRIINNLLKQNQNWLTYPGALTSPPYSETVTWIIFAKTFPISENQLNRFRQLKRQDGNLNLEYRRKVYPSNRRPILTNFECNKQTFSKSTEISLLQSIDLSSSANIKL